MSLINTFFIEGVGYGGFLLPLFLILFGLHLIFFKGFRSRVLILLLALQSILIYAVNAQIKGYPSPLIGVSAGGKLGKLLVDSWAKAIDPKILIFILVVLLLSPLLAFLKRPFSFSLYLVSWSLLFGLLGQGFYKSSLYKSGNYAFLISFLFIFLAFLQEIRLKRKGFEDIFQTKELFNLNFKLELAVVILIVLVGLYFRLAHLTAFPPGFYYDEGVRATEAYDWAKAPTLAAKWRIISERLFKLPVIYMLLLGHFPLIFGKTAASARLASVAFGMVTIPLFYILARKFYGQLTAIISALLLAVSHWHTNYSRVAFGGIQTPFFVILALYFFWLGRTSSKIHYLWLLIVLLLAFPAYSALKILPAVFVLFIAFAIFRWVIIGFKSGRFYIRRKQLIVSGLILIILLSFGYLEINTGYFRRLFSLEFGESERLTNLFAFAGVDKSEYWKVLKPNVIRYMRMFNREGDGNPRHNLPFAPQLEFTASSLFVLGFFYVILRFYDPKHFLLLSTFFIMLLPGILSNEGHPHSLRTIGTLAPALLFAAIFLSTFLKMLFRSLGKYLGLVTIPVLGFTLFIFTKEGYEIYFKQQMTNANCWREFDTAQIKAAEYLNALNEIYKEKYRAILTDYYFNASPGFRYLALDVSRSAPFRIDEHIPIRDTDNLPFFFLYEQTFMKLQSMLEFFYPNGEVIVHKDPWGNTMFYTFFVSPMDIEAARGLKGAYFSGSELQGEPIFERNDKNINFDWEINPLPLKPPFSIRWSGSFIVPKTSTYSFSLTSDEICSLKINDRLIIDKRKDLTSASSPLIGLGKGIHNLEINYTETNGKGGIKLTYSSGVKGESLIPDHLLISRIVDDPILMGYQFADFSIILRLEDYFTVESRNEPKGAIMKDFDIDTKGNFYIIIGDSVVKYDRNKNYIKEWGGFGFKSENFRGPGGIAVDSNDDVLVNDTWNVRLKKFSNDGVLIKEFQFPLWAATGITVDKKDNIYIADTGLTRFVKINPAWKMEFWKGGRGIDAGSFTSPADVAVSSSGLIFVNDYSNLNIQRFSPSGEFQKTWRMEGMNEFSYMAFDKNDILFVNIPSLAEVQAYTIEGEKIPITIKLAPDVPRLMQPAGIAVDRDNFLYIGDKGRYLIYKFAIEIEKQ